MKKIKYRAWDKTKKRYTKNIVIDSDGILYWSFGYSSNEMIEDPENYIIERFTGLSDEDGKEIYEGDFIEFTYWWFCGHEAESTFSGYIAYNENHMSFTLVGIKNKDWIRHIGGQEGESDECSFAYFNFVDANFRLIGSVHEKPELIQSEQITPS